MGTGIALVAAVVAKKHVIIVDVSSKQVDSALQFVDGWLGKSVTKGKLTSDEAKQARSRLSASTQFQELSKADFCIEAATENSDLKKIIYSALRDYQATSDLSKQHLVYFYHQNCSEYETA